MHRRAAFLVLLASVATSCSEERKRDGGVDAGAADGGRTCGVDGECDDGEACTDADGDGFAAATCGGDDCDDTDPLVSPGAAEACGNTVDDDCDGETDEDCECEPASEGGCTTSCGSTSTRYCGADGLWGLCEAPPEECNGRDDDCDETCDDGFDCCAGSDAPCTTECGLMGLASCDGACTLGACLPPVESCNGEDDDCDGVCDDGFDCCANGTEPCTTDCGSTGSRLCSASCSAGACVAPPESCNGLDDDCDGACDDGLACCAGETLACTTVCGSTGTGVCTSSCEVPAPAACVPPVEVCNGLDDDCDGMADDGFDCVEGATVACSTDCGSIGSGTCTSSCTVPTGASCAAPAETCNGADDDCDGMADDGFDCVEGAAVACATDCGSTGSGACTPSCTVPTGASCTAPAESCNGADDDCDGGCDDGFACCAGTPATCTTTCGTPGERSCSATCALGACLAASETCDNDCDDDGDGTADEGCPPPARDECAGARSITLGGGRTTVSGTTALGTDTVGSCSSAPDLWFSFTLARREIVYVNTHGSAYDTVLGLRTGSCAGPIVCRDDDCGTTSSEVLVELDAGTHYVAVDGAGAAAGVFTLNIEHVPVGAAGAAVLPPGSSSPTGSLPRGGTSSPPCDSPDWLYYCDAGERTLYWSRCPSASGGTFTATACTSGTSGFLDSALYLVSGRTGGSLACGGDLGASCGFGFASARINTTVPSGEGLYALQVDGWIRAPDMVTCSSVGFGLSVSRP